MNELEGKEKEVIRRRKSIVKLDRTFFYNYN